MSITGEITRINTNIANAYTVCRNKGATIPITQNSSNLANTINSITTGGGETEEKDVNFYDYDGTIVNSYTKSEFLALESLPENPTHQGLTSQGWNWNLSSAKNYVTTYDKLNIGQMYVTDDNKTRIYVTLDQDTLDPYLGFAINGSATIEWGDGNSEIVTGTSINNPIYTQHHYSNSGDYVIKISSQSNIKLNGAEKKGSYILVKNTNAYSENRNYQNAIKKIELNDCTKIDSYAFVYCSSLKSITIPSSVTSIGVSAFYDCSSLKSITIPSGVTSIGSYAFQYCSSLKSITIPSGITSIGDGTFNSCSSLKSITIPSGVTRIGNSAFYDCSSLKSITIPSGVTSMGSTTFYHCFSLESIIIPSGVTKIDNNAFQYCSSLKSITIPSSVTSIGSSVFNSCLSLKSITIPNSVTSIGSYAFSSCYSMSNYNFSNHQVVPTLSDKYAFSGIVSDCKIIVPDSLYNDWIIATNWSNFTNYIVKASEM